MDKFKALLCSESGMRLVNLLFFFSVFIRYWPLATCAYIVWIAFLLYAGKQAESKGTKLAYTILGLYAVVVVVIILYFNLLRPLLV